jgi:BMFP domain-containing protein YqiC
MQTTIKILDDIAKVGASLLGLAIGVKKELKHKLKARAENIAREMDLVTRDEFEIVRAMAQKAREENEVLKKQLDKKTPKS